MRPFPLADEHGEGLHTSAFAVDDVAAAIDYLSDESATSPSSAAAAASLGFVQDGNPSAFSSNAPSFGAVTEPRDLSDKGQLAVVDSIQNDG